MRCSYCDGTLFTEDQGDVRCLMCGRDRLAPGVAPTPEPVYVSDQCCPSCHLTKPLTAFGLIKHTHTRQSTCISCGRAAAVRTRWVEAG